MKTIVGLLFVLLAGGIAAQDVLDLPPGRWWKNEEVIRTLKLSPDQQRKLDDIMFAHMEQMIDFKAAYDKEELKLRLLLDQPSVEEAKVLQQVDRLLAAHDQMQRSRARMFVKVRLLLGPEQWEKVKGMFKDRVKDRMRDRMRMERGQGGMPGTPQPRPEEERPPGEL
jgi:Spy/CpxP family protein refolding chaperone